MYISIIFKISPSHCINLGKIWKYFRIGSDSAEIKQNKIAQIFSLEIYKYFFISMGFFLQLLLLFCDTPQALGNSPATVTVMLRDL